MSAFSRFIIATVAAAYSVARADALKTLHNLAGIKIAGFTIRSKIYNEVFTNNQMFQLLNIPAGGGVEDSSATALKEPFHRIIETQTNFHNLYIVILGISTISFLVDLGSEYRVEKLKNTKYFNKLEKSIEIFIIVFMTIMMRDVENAI